MEHEKLLGLLKNAEANFKIYVTQIQGEWNMPDLELEPCLKQARQDILDAIKMLEVQS